VGLDELKEKLRGVLVVMVTPFTEKDEVDEEGLRENTRFLVEKGVNVLVPTGSTGEFYALFDDERKKVIRTVVDEANGKVPVVAGTAHAGTKLTLEMSRYAEDVGADGAMIVSPYYHHPSDEGIYQHYRTVAEGLNIGIMVYNNPRTSKVTIKPPLMARLAEIDQIVADKETTYDMKQFHDMISLVGDKIQVLCGMGELWYSFVAPLGSPGFISSTANFAPEISLNLYHAAEKGDFAEVKRVIEFISPLERLSDKLGHRFVSMVKEAMNLLGLSGGRVRLPLTPLTENEEKELRKALASLGKLEE